MADVFAGYLDGDPRLQPFFAGAPQSVLEQAPREVRCAPDLVAAVNREQERLGATGRLPQQGVVVCTGQQPALFLGPLYTIYKAATAILLARRIATKFAVTATPVFWLGADDHDFEEARTAWVLDRDHRPRALTFEPESDVQGKPLHGIPVEPGLHQLVDEARAACFGSSASDAVAATLHEALERANSFADWSAHLLARLFTGTPLVIFSPTMPEARQAAVPVLERGIQQPAEAGTLANQAGEQLAALGYDPQVVKRDDAAGFFLETDGRRCAVTAAGQGYQVRESRQRFTVEEARSLLAGAPERFSPDVTLRPVVQQALLRPAAYVGGPGEVAYWAQLKPVFEAHGHPMPVVYPRLRCLLTTLKLNKLLARTGLHASQLTDPEDALLARALAAQPRNAAEEVLETLSRPVQARVAELRQALSPHDDTAGQMVRGMERRVGRDLDRLRQRLARADAERVRVVTRRVKRLQDELAPYRKPQERVYSVVSPWLTQGDQLVSKLLQSLDVTEFDVQEVEL